MAWSLQVIQGHGSRSITITLITCQHLQLLMARQSLIFIVLVAARALRVQVRDLHYVGRISISRPCS